MKNHKEHTVTDSTLFKYLQKQTSEKENEHIKNWLKDDPDNQLRINSLQKLLIYNDSINDFELIDTNGDWTKVKSRIDNVKSKSTTKRLKFLFSMITRIAAVLILVVGLTIIIKNFVITEPEMLVHSTELNQSEVLLADGSRVYLNEHSELSYPDKFSKKERVVNLKGEAYFEVNRDEKKSFIVHTSRNAVIKVLGTSFNINADTGSSTVTVHVTSGKVAFYKNDNATTKAILTKNDKAVLDNNIISKTFIDDPNFLSWKTGIMEFRNSPLLTVIDQLADFYKQPIQIKNQKIGAYKYTSTIDNQPLDDVLDEIKLVLNLEYIRKNDTIFIYPNQ